MVHADVDVSSAPTEATRREILIHLTAAKLAMTRHLCDVSAMLDGYDYTGEERRKAWRDTKRRACDWWLKQVALMRERYPEPHHQRLIDDLIPKIFPDFASYRPK